MDNDKPSIEQLAQEQNIKPVTDFSEFATLIDLPDEEFNNFLRTVIASRGFHLTSRNNIIFNLIKEAMVLGYVEGCWGTTKHTVENFPQDSDIISVVLQAAQSNADIYPLLSLIKIAIETQ